MDCDETNQTKPNQAKLLTTLPPEICRLVNLKTLICTGCHLVSLPSEIGNLTIIRIPSLPLPREIEE